MVTKAKIFIFLFFIVLISRINSQELNEAELSNILKGDDVAFILYDYNNDQYIRYNKEVCATPYRPASTFKILLSLIGLEIQAVKSENDTIKYSGFEWRTISWNRDHTLRSALKYSVEWYFQEVAKRVGLENMQYYLDATNFGNNTIGENVERFWLDGNLKISPDEQIIFLKKLYDNDLPFSLDNLKTVKDMMISETKEDYTLRGKTGTGVIRGIGMIGWYVGYIERDNNVYIFSFNKISGNFYKLKKERLEIGKRVLAQLGLISDEIDNTEIE